MLEQTTTNLAITGDATGFLSMYGLGQLLITFAGIGVFVVIIYIMWQFAKIYKSAAWYVITKDAYRVGMIKKHAIENSIELCYEPTKAEKGLMQCLDEDVKRDIESV